MKKRWTPQDNQYLQANYNHLSNAELATILDRTEYSIQHRATRLGLSQSLDLWTSEEDEYLRQNYGELPMKELLEQLPNRTANSIKLRAGHLGLSIQERWTQAEDDYLRATYGKILFKAIAEHLPNRTHLSIKNRVTALHLGQKKLIYALNHDYFKIPNLENCYWAGFLAADGCVYKNRVHLIQNSRAKSHLQRFKDDIGFSGEIVDFKLQQGYLRSSIIIYSPQWVTDLQTNFKITPRKSHTLQPPELSGDLALAFIKGVIDGDGGIYRQTNSRGDYYTLKILGTSAMLTWIKAHIDGLVSPNISPEVRPYSTVHVHQTCGVMAKQFLDVLAALPTPQLERKWSLLRTSNV